MDPRQLTESINQYSNAILKLEADLEMLKQRRRSLEIERDELFAPRREEPAKIFTPTRSDVKATCHLCGAQTKSRTRTDTGYLVAECRPFCRETRQPREERRVIAARYAGMLDALGL